MEKNLYSLIHANSMEVTYGIGDKIMFKDFKYDTIFFFEGLAKVYIKNEKASVFSHYLLPENNHIINLMTDRDEFSPLYTISFLKKTKLLFVSNSLVEEWSDQYLSLKQAILHSYQYNVCSLLTYYKNLIFSSSLERIHAVSYTHLTLPTTSRV